MCICGLLCLCIGGTNWPYLVNVRFLPVAGLVSLVEDSVSR